MFIYISRKCIYSPACCISKMYLKFMKGFVFFLQSPALSQKHVRNVSQTAQYLNKFYIDKCILKIQNKQTYKHKCNFHYIAMLMMSQIGLFQEGGREGVDNKLVLQPAEILRPKTRTPGRKFHMTFSCPPQKFHICFNKPLEIPPQPPCLFFPAHFEICGFHIQKHKNHDILRSKYIFFKQKNSLITYQGLLYSIHAKNQFCNGGNLKQNYTFKTKMFIL